MDLQKKEAANESGLKQCQKGTKCHPTDCPFIKSCAQYYRAKEISGPRPRHWDAASCGPGLEDLARGGDFSGPERVATARVQTYTRISAADREHFTGAEKIRSTSISKPTTALTVMAFRCRGNGREAMARQDICRTESGVAKTVTRGSRHPVCRTRGGTRR